MNLRVITVGKIRDNYLNEGIEEYRKRLSSWLKIELVELKANKVARGSDEALQEEGTRIIKKIKSNDYVIALTSEGKQFNSDALAEKMQRILSAGYSNIDIIIGSHEGLSQEVKNRADLLLSLSKLTFSSQLTRLILMEQIFRCMKIIRGEPYHR